VADCRETRSGIDGAWTYAVHAYLILGKTYRHPLGQGDHAAFGSRVGISVGTRPYAVGGGGVDDRAASACSHVRDRQLREQEDALEIHRDHGIQLKALYEKNLMASGTQPAAGEIIYLRQSRDSLPKLKEETITQKKVSPLGNTTLVTQYHTVLKGDTLYSISKRYNISVNELRQMNNLASNDLHVGEKLRVMK